MPAATNTHPQNYDRVGGSKVFAPELGVKASSPPMSPVVFLRDYFARVQGPDPANSPPTKSQHCCFFTKPSEEEMAAYDTEIVNTIRAADENRLRTYLNEGRSMNACNRFGESLLHMACRRGNASIVSFLVNEARASINVRDDYGRTPFHDACWTSTPNFDVMDVLLNSVADPHMLLSEDVRGHTPFDYARREHWDAWVTFLRQRGDVLRKAPRQP